MLISVRGAILIEIYPDYIILTVFIGIEQPNIDNGNGRHSRLMADTLAVRLGLLPFSWGRADLVEAGEVRDRYLSALRDADRCDLEPLLEFAQS